MGKTTGTPDLRTLRRITYAPTNRRTWKKTTGLIFGSNRAVSQSVVLWASRSGTTKIATSSAVVDKGMYRLFSTHCVFGSRCRQSPDTHPAPGSG
jgi:hypothetical protein